VTVAARRLAALVTAALVLAGCAVAPLDRYLLQPDAPPARVEGAHGILSRTESTRILDELRRTSPDSAVLDRHLAIEQALAGTPLSLGNKAEILEDGAQAYASMLAAIRSARSHVHMEMYIFEDDEVGRRFGAALKERARAGVKVRLIYDAVGSLNTSKDFFRDLAAGGVEVAEFAPVSVTNVLKDGLKVQDRDHRKLAIVDGKVAFLGGINISAVYGTASSRAHRRSVLSASGSSDAAGGDPPFKDRPWRDLQVRLEGPVVADLQRTFAAHWEKLGGSLGDPKALYPPLARAGDEFVRAIAASSAEKGVNATYVALISAVQSAEKSVAIMNAYFVPHPELLGALEGAARRGVEVTMILPSRSDNPLVYHAGRSYYEELLAAGVKIYERKTRLLHAKSATVDGVWSTVGSTNLDWRSLIYNDELDAVVLGPRFAAQVQAVFAKDLAESEEVTLQSWRHRPLQDRLKELSARAWAYML
jgi:cardiolipin synthase